MCSKPLRVRGFLTTLAAFSVHDPVGLHEDGWRSVFLFWLFIRLPLLRPVVKRCSRCSAKRQQMPLSPCR